MPDDKYYKWHTIVCIMSLYTLLSCSTAVLPQGLSELGFYSDSKTIIQTLGQKQELSSTEHFMMGVAYKNIKDQKKAIFHFANSCFVEQRAQKLVLYPQPVYRFVSRLSVKSHLYNDAVYEIARCFMFYQEHEYVIKFIDLMKKEKSGVYRDGQLLKADALMQMKRFHQAEKVITKTVSIFSDADSLAWLYLRLASVYERQDHYDKAVHSYIDLLEESTKNWQSQIAARRIIQIIGRNTDITVPPDGIRMIIEALYNTKSYQDIIDLDTSIFEVIQEKSQRHAVDSLLMKTYSQLGRINDLRRLYAVYESTDYWDDSAAAIVQTLWGANRKRDAREWIDKLENSQDEQFRKTALFYKALISIERKEAVSKAVDDYIALYPDDSTAERILWLHIRNNITHPERAKYYLEKFYRTFGYKGRNADEVFFWLYNYTKNDNPEAAEKIAYEMVAQLPHSVYSWILLERLSPLYSMEKVTSDFSMAIQTHNLISALFSHAMMTYKERDENKRLQRIELIQTSFPDNKEIDYDKIPDLNESMSFRTIPSSMVARVEHYFSIGYSEGIGREFSVFSNPGSEEVFSIGYLYGLKYNNYYMSVLSLVQLLRYHKLTENVFLMNSDALDSLLPKPFAECVAKSSAKYNVSQPLIYAVMKAESLFNPSAESPAGAIGLMQLMIPTAKDIGRSIGMTPVNKEMLKDPCVSIEKGTYYIDWLMKKLDNNLTLVAAAYNAGIGNVRRWKFENEDLFTATVPFAETKGYIERIKKFHYQYRLLYDLRKNK